MEKEAKKEVLCAIYTRKSTSEGLDEEFSSLDAQREACENYIKSQRHEGWILLKEHYDDGGFSGADLDRPALQRLLSDIRKGIINCVVVYKVDRLSRSLLDFAQLLEFFEKYGVSFVSVTQQFNTNTSMGRLTLNILLSFAQFEREIISERTKDKMALARKRGQWLGGRPPLGYDIDRNQKKLVVNQEEAKLVREIFELYLKENSLLKVAQILTQKGHRTKVTTSQKGRTFGGFKYGVTQIQSILTNVLYIGKVSYKGEIFAGQQEAIIDEDTFKKVQEKLKENRVTRKTLKNTDCTGLLNHMLFCKSCRKAMFHTYTLKDKTHKYRYYICTNTQKHGYKSCPTKSLNAQVIEDVTLDCLRRIFLEEKFDDFSYKKEIEAFLSPVWESLFLEEKRKLLKSFVKEITYEPKVKKLEIVLKEIDKIFEFEVDLKEVRTKKLYRKEKEIQKEPKIRRNLILAYQIQGLIDKENLSLKKVSVWLNLSQVRLDQLMNLLLLSPKIKKDILCLESSILKDIPEYKLRGIYSEILWQNQERLWQELITNQKANL